jgi:hypothetical protein
LITRGLEIAIRRIGVDFETVARQCGREHESSGSYSVESRYQTTAGEDAAD